MAYPLDVAAQNAGLKAWFGDGRAASVPSSWEVVIYDAHPLNGGAELAADGGYERLVAANNSTNFPDPVDGLMTSADLTFADATDAYSTTGTHYGLIDHADSTTLWFVGALPTELVIDEAQPGFVVNVEVAWNTEGL